MKAFKYFPLLLFILILFSACGSETIKSDIYVKKNYPLSKARKLIVGHFNIRTYVPYAKLNFADQLEYHLLKRNYDVIPRENLSDFYSKKELKRHRLLTKKEIQKAYESTPFDLYIQGILYEEDRSIFDEGNHIIVFLNFYNPRGDKVSTVRYIYTGERSLISGELIDESISLMLDRFESK